MKIDRARVCTEAGFAVLTAGLASPVFAGAHAPLQDLPQHIAAVSVLRRLLTGGSLDAIFEATLSRTQYLLVYVLGVPLSFVAGAEGSLRLLAALTLVAIPYAMRFALRRTGSDERLAALTWPLLWNPQFFLGFLNLMIGVPLALVAIGLFAPVQTRARRSVQISLAVLALGTFYAHLIPFGVLGLGVLALVRVPRRATLRADLAVAARELAFLGPALLAAVVWVLRTPAADAAVRAGGIGTGPRAEWPVVASLARDLSGTLLDVPGDRDERLLLAWGLGVLAAVALASRDRSGDDGPRAARWPLAAAALFAGAYVLRHRTFAALWGPELPPEETWGEIAFRGAMLASAGAFVGAARWPTADSSTPFPAAPSVAWVPLACALLYLVTPTSYGWIWPIHTRFALVGALLVPLWIPRRSLGRGGWLLVAAMGLASLGLAVDLRHRFVEWNASELGDLDEALAHALPGRRLVAILAPTASTWVPNVPTLHAAAYYQARGGAVATFSFADFPQSPFRYREGPARPPRLAPRWEWTSSLASADPGRSYYDYVLVRRGAIDEPARDPTAYRTVYAGRDWVLYERIEEVIP